MNILAWTMDLLFLVMLQVPFLSKGFDIHTCEFLKIYSNKFHKLQHKLRDYSCHAPVLRSDGTHLVSVEECMPLYSASFT